jgi:endonuclease/exonuclease/phosphatase (EEP) superfamily protein YafD
VSVILAALLIGSWIMVVLGIVGVATRVAGTSRFAAVALLHDGLPIVLGFAWVALAVSVARGDAVLGTLGAILAANFVWIWWKARRRVRPPRWARRAPTFRMVVANVFVDNETPDAMAKELCSVDADLIVIAEWNSQIASALVRAGACDQFPYWITDDSDHSDYAVAVLARIEPTESVIEQLDELSIVRAVFAFGDRPITIVGINAHATVDPGGYSHWLDETDALVRLARTITTPFVVAGDFNSTQYRPGFQRLLDLGLRDAHDALGLGLSRSFKLRANGPASTMGPVARLDHSLATQHLCVIDTADLDAAGSDHVPFVVTYAVRPTQRGRRYGSTVAAIDSAASIG